MRKFKLTTLLLAIITALTFGFTSCTEEFGGDNTQGKPGYLTINVKTLKLNQSKNTVVSDNDYKKIVDLNIFIFDGENIFLHKYYDQAATSALTKTDNTYTMDIPITTLPVESKIVVVANYSGDMMSITDHPITTLQHLKDVEIEVIRDMHTKGLHMTGMADIIDSDPAGGYYTDVRIAPVESKITVDWTLSSYIAQHYEVTGVYVVNAIGKTKLPIIRNHTYSGSIWSSSDSESSSARNFGIISKINQIGATPQTQRVAYTGYDFNNLGTKVTTALENGIHKISANTTDFAFYEDLTEDGTVTLTTGGLRNEIDESIVREESYIALATTATPLHFYVGENYSYLSATSGSKIIKNATFTDNANTIVVVRVSPKVVPADGFTATPIQKTRYYTYELYKDSHANNKALEVVPPATTSVVPEGFSTKRKTNYKLTFNLSTLGSELPFERIKNLNVKVTGEGWDEAGVNAPF